MNWFKKAQTNNLQTITINNVRTGQPCIVQAYHGTPDGRFLPEFNPQKSGYYPDAPEMLADNNDEFIDTYGEIGQGFRDKSSTGHIGVSFTDNYQTAKSYSEKPAFDYRSSIPMIVQRYVKLENPKVIDISGQKWKISVNDDINIAIKEGYDSLVLKNIKDNYHPGTTLNPTNNLIIFNTNNINQSIENLNNKDNLNSNEYQDKNNLNDNEYYDEDNLDNNELV